MYLLSGLYHELSDSTPGSSPGAVSLNSVKSAMSHAHTQNSRVIKTLNARVSTDDWAVMTHR
ncbi:MAG: hypothetical protein A07HR60_00172 [uncultured archaeon A07HR60]|nr:MAG: hypothetical protein A07HR60_00172 [uncultured archaeon A07HR60]